MNEIELHERFDEIQYELERRAISFEIEPPYWLIDHNEYDQGFSFCWDCAKEVLGCEPEFGENIEGGYECESDSVALCEKCHKILDYTLTDYGTKEELGHYEEHTPSTKDLENPEECFQLTRLSWAIFFSEDRRRFVALFPETFGVAGNVPEGSES